MITPDNIPATAIKRQLIAHNGKKGIYHVWQTPSGWVWTAQGNCGEEPTQNLAMERARRWIRDGQ